MGGIVWLSAETPDAHGGGGHRRQFHQIRVLLESGIGVRVATLNGPQSDASLRPLCRVDRFSAARFTRLRANREVARLAAGASAAVVAHIESLPHVERALRSAGIPWLLDFHNVNSRWHDLLGEPREAADWRRRERSALHAATRSTACSEEERRSLQALAPDADVQVAGHGVERGEWPESALAGERTPAVAVFGAWQHGPNSEGAVWLAERVWPAVRDSVPEARLLLAGPGEPPGAALAVPGVEDVGRVDDLAHFLGGVRVVAVPIVRGIGARVKFGEALASGAAVVSTSVGAEGFAADGAFVRADDPETFAHACSELLLDGDRAAALGHAGRTLALGQFSWERTTEPIVRFAESAA